MKTAAAILIAALLAPDASAVSSVTTVQLELLGIDVSLPSAANWSARTSGKDDARIDVLSRPISGGYQSIILKPVFSRSGNCAQWVKIVAEQDGWAIDRNPAVSPEGWHPVAIISANRSLSVLCHDFAGGVLTMRFDGPTSATKPADLAALTVALEAISRAVAQRRLTP